MSDVEPLSGVLDRMLQAEDRDPVDLGSVIDALGERGFGPLLILPSLIAVSPVGAIPGMGPITGTLIVLFAGQMLLGADGPWVPGWLRRMSFSRDKLDAAIRRAQKGATWLEVLIKPRLKALSGPAVSKLIAGIFVVLGVAMFPLSLVPGGNAAAGAATGLLAIGIVAKDGLITAFGLAVALLAGWLLLGLL